MFDLFSDDARRNPYPLYDLVRATYPVLRVPPPFDAWLVLDYDGVKQVLSDPQTFSSAVPAPKNWFLFTDPPRHTRQRALIARAFTPRVIANLERHIRELSRSLLDGVVARGEMDLAGEYAVPLPMKVIAEMIGIPPEDWHRFRRWSDVILELSLARSGGPEAEAAVEHFTAVTEEMNEYLAAMIAARRAAPRDDLLTRLVEATIADPDADADADVVVRRRRGLEVESEPEGQRLTQYEILGFFQLLVVGGQETTANLINNAVLCFLEHPDQLERVRADAALLPAAIEEVLRYRSPLQWIMRTPTRDVELAGQRIPARRLVLVMLGSANRDPRHFERADEFDVTRNPNPHLAFGHGTHFCLGAALSRMEARIALTDLLTRLPGLRRPDDTPWEPRKALHVHGPARLPVRFDTE